MTLGTAAPRPGAEQIEIERLRAHVAALEQLIEVHEGTVLEQAHRLEEALSQLDARARELERSNQELETFAYIASHDLQEPLRMVASYTQLLERRYSDKLDETAREFIGFAVDGATRMQALIRALLEYSRVGTKGQELTPVSLDEVLDTVRRDLTIAAQESGARITNDPLPTVIADRTQITQLIQNLVGNGLKFRGAEPARVHVSAEERPSEWVVTVRDEGIGIDPRFGERIFQIFQRLHGPAEYSGTGIGLAVCRRIVERHGGRIWVESQPGHGAAFHFTILRREAK